MYEYVEIQAELWARPVSGAPSIIQPLIAHLCGVPAEELLAKRGSARVVFARQIAMYLMHVIYGRNMAEVAAFFGRERSTASYACHKIEDLRDDPGFDRQLMQVENLLRNAAALGVSL